jgi:hypothetical protein
MTCSALVTRSWNGHAIQRRRSDGYVNATAMAKAAGRQLCHYMANRRSSEYSQALAHVIGIPMTALVESIQGGRADLQGTWVHPRLAVDIARWISPEFAVWMDGWILEELETSSREAAPPAVPFTREELSGLMGLVCNEISETAGRVGCFSGFPWSSGSLSDAHGLMERIKGYVGIADRILPMIRPAVPGELGGPRGSAHRQT